MKHLVLGGVKSGKSKHAELIAESLLSTVNYSSVALVATAQALDDEMAQRIKRHQEDRPKNWRVIEEPLYLADLLKSEFSDEAVFVVDCLTLWLTNLLMLENNEALEAEVEKFIVAVKEFKGTLILVSNETNMGIMPLGEMSRRFCDIAGTLHKRLAQACEKVDLVVAGLPMNLKPGCQCVGEGYSGAKYG